MEILNVAEMKEKLFRKGFDRHLDGALDEQIKAGNTEFILDHAASIGKDEIDYKLHFRVDEPNNKLYLNIIDATLSKNEDTPGIVREQSFPADWLITATEMHRMLKHGLMVAVNKDLFNKEGNAYNTWISVNVNGAKDEVYNNYPVQTYHENYFKKEPFLIQEALQKLPVPVKEIMNGTPQELERIEKRLKKADLIPVIMMLDGKETTGTLAVNPGERRIDVYDKSMKLVQAQAQQNTIAPAAKEEKSVQQSQDDLKKKSQPNPVVTWEQKKPGNRLSM